MLTDTLFTSSMLALACAAILFICLIIWIKYGKTKKTNSKVNAYAAANANPEATKEVTDSKETEAACADNGTEDIVEAVDDFMNEPVDEESNTSSVKEVTPVDISEELAETSEESVDAEEEE